MLGYIFKWYFLISLFIFKFLAFSNKSFVESEVDLGASKKVNKLITFIHLNNKIRNFIFFLWLMNLLQESLFTKEWRIILKMKFESQIHIKKTSSCWRITKLTINMSELLSSKRIEILHINKYCSVWLWENAINN